MSETVTETHFSADQHATLNALAETFQALSFIGSCAVVGSYVLFPRLRKVSSKSRRPPTHRLALPRGSPIKPTDRAPCNIHRADTPTLQILSSRSTS
jgi:hypothetical protein